MLVALPPLINGPLQHLYMHIKKPLTMKFLLLIKIAGPLICTISWIGKI